MSSPLPMGTWTRPRPSSLPVDLAWLKQARAPQGFTAKNLGNGEVYLTAPAGAYSVNWRYSVDGGKTWLDAGQTGVAHTTIPDLTPGILTLFSNQRVLASTVEGWSDPISLMVT